MKKILIAALCALLTLVPLIASAQDREKGKAKEPATKLEAFLAKKGKLIIKDSQELGEIAGRYGAKITFDALVIYERGQESQKVRGLKIEVTEGGRYKRSNTSFIDLDEIQSLSEAIEYMIALSTKWKDVSEEYTEVMFLTKGDFNIGFYRKGTEMHAFSSSGYIGRASCFFSSMEDLRSVKAITDKGLKLLREK